MKFISQIHRTLKRIFRENRFDETEIISILDRTIAIIRNKITNRLNTNNLIKYPLIEFELSKNSNIHHCIDKY